MFWLILSAKLKHTFCMSFNYFNYIPDLLNIFCTNYLKHSPHLKCGCVVKLDWKQNLFGRAEKRRLLLYWKFSCCIPMLGKRVSTKNCNRLQFRWPKNTFLPYVTQSTVKYKNKPGLVLNLIVIKYMLLLWLCFVIRH